MQIGLTSLRGWGGQRIGRRWVSTGLLIACAAVCVASGRTGRSSARSNDPTLSPITLAEPRVVVIKSLRVLHLLNGETLVRSYPVDLGKQPEGTKKLGLDQRTPEGCYRIVSKNANSPYHRFLGFDFPSEPAISDGLTHGLISVGEARALRSAQDVGARPRWTTDLGGGVGIHGRREGRDWTGGCIALSDEHVEELFQVLRIGDPVEILP